MCVCACVHTHGGVYIHVCRGQMSILAVVSWKLFTLCFFETASLIDLDFTDLSRLAGQQTPRTPRLHLPSTGIIRVHRLARLF